MNIQMLGKPRSNGPGSGSLGWFPPAAPTCTLQRASPKWACPAYIVDARQATTCRPLSMILAPPALWPGPRPSQSAARSLPPRTETPTLPATCRWPCRLLRSQPAQPSHGRGNASSRPFRWRSLGRRSHLSDLVPRVSAGVVPRFAGHGVPPRHLESQTVFDGRRIALAAAGI